THLETFVFINNTRYAVISHYFPLFPMISHDFPLFLIIHSYFRSLMDSDLEAIASACGPTLTNFTTRNAYISGSLFSFFLFLTCSCFPRFRRHVPALRRPLPQTANHLHPRRPHPRHFHRT